MKFSKYISILAASALLASCAVSSTSEGTRPGEVKAGLFGMSTQDAVVVATPKAFSARNQVVIGGFNVAFVESKKESAKAGSGMGGKASADVTLLGIDQNVESAVTEAAYADFVAQLKAQGYTVLDRSALLAGDFAKAAKETSPYRKEASFFGSDSAITTMAPAEIGGVYFVNGENGAFAAIGSGNPVMGAVSYAEKSGVPVLFVNYTVDFANGGGTVSHYALMASMEVGQGISVAPGGGIALFGGQGGTFSTNSGTIKLGQPVFSTETFGTVIDKSTTAGIVAETALNVFTSVLGGGSNQSRSYDIQADPAKYAAIATTVLKNANTAIVGKMSSLR